MRLIWGAALLALAAAQAGAADTPAKAEKNKPRLVCFSDAPTGSHIRKRTCMTEEEYEARRKRDQEAMQRMKPIERPAHQGGP